MGITLILATDKNGCIGKAGVLPWKIRSEMQYFLKRVAFTNIVMGKDTCLGLFKPINSATNYVLTRDKNFKREGFVTVHSIEELMEKNQGRELIVAGGLTVYNNFIEYCKENNKSFSIEVSTIDLEVVGGDRFFNKEQLQNTKEYKKEFLCKNKTTGEPDWEAHSYTYIGNK